MHNRPTRRVSGKQLSCGLIHEQAHPNRTGETLRKAVSAKLNWENGKENSFFA